MTRERALAPPGRRRATRRRIDCAAQGPRTKNVRPSSRRNGGCLGNRATPSEVLRLRGGSAETKKTGTRASR